MRHWWMRSWKWADACAGALVALFGVLCLAAPGFLLRFISIAVGSSILLFGAVQGFRSVRINKTAGALPMPMLLSGVIAAVVGLMFLIHPSTPVAIFATIFGIWALGSGAVKMNRAIGARQSGNSSAWMFVQSFIHIAFGFYLIINPVNITELWVRVVGVYLAYLGIVFMIGALTAKEEPF